MRTFLDDHPLKPEPATPADALRAGSNAAQRKGRIIVEIIADGQPLAPEELGAPAHAPVAELRLVSAEPRAIVHDALGEARAILADLHAAQTHAGDAFLMGEFETGTANLREIIGAWQRVRSALEQSAALLAVPVDTLQLDAGDGPRPMRNEIETLAAALGQLKEAISRQDVAALADLLEYDLGALARRWDRMLGAFLGIGQTRTKSCECS